MDNYLAIKALWLSVILQAISDYYSSENRGFSASAQRSAANWLFSDDRNWNSFIELGGHFDIDYRNIRRTLSKCRSLKQFKEAMYSVETAAAREERILNMGMVFRLGSYARRMPAVFNPVAEE